MTELAEIGDRRSVIRSRWLEIAGKRCHLYKFNNCVCLLPLSLLNGIRNEERSKASAANRVYSGNLEQWNHTFLKRGYRNTNFSLNKHTTAHNIFFV
jgi:hypothetical protein